MKDETLLPDVDSLEKVLEWVAGLPVPTKSATANYCRLKNFITDYRAAIQSGNSGQVPAGYVLVPVEPTQEMIDAHVEGVQSGGMRKGYRAMLAASPPVSDGWIPVNERMPEPGRWLALYGAPVYTHGPDAGKPWRKFTVGEGYLDKEDGKFYLLNWESPGEIGDSYNNLLAIATHWMYWELPDAPKVKP